MAKQPRVLKPVIDNLDLAIGQGASVATLRLTLLEALFNRSLPRAIPPCAWVACW